MKFLFWNIRIILDKVELYLIMNCPSVDYTPVSDQARVMLTLEESATFPKASSKDDNEEYRKAMWKSLVTHISTGNNRKRAINNDNNDNYKGF